MEWAEWSCSSPAPEPHYFWYPEGLVYLWFPSWGFWYYWERPVWLYLFLYFCFYLVRNISCLQNQLKINQSRGIFIFHFVRADHSGVPRGCSAHICGDSKEEFFPALKVQLQKAHIKLPWKEPWQGAVVILLRQEWVADGILVLFSRIQKLCGNFVYWVPLEPSFTSSWLTF